MRVQTAVIKEALRISYGASGRLYKISNDKSLTFKDGAKDWVLPPGVSTTFPLSQNLADVE